MRCVTVLIVAIVALIGAVIVVVYVKVTREPTPAPTATVEAAPFVPVEGEVPMGFTEDGSPYRGDPDAPVVLQEHSEFQ